MGPLAVQTPMSGTATRLGGALVLQAPHGEQSFGAHPDGHQHGEHGANIMGSV